MPLVHLLFSGKSPLIYIARDTRIVLCCAFFCPFPAESAGSIITEFVPMRYVISMTLTTLSLLLMPAARADIMSILPCGSSDITVHTDDRSGLYDGMSQSGTSLVLRNTGSRACMLPPRPVLTFSDAAHHPMVVERRPVRGMNPGPVLLPVTVPADHELQILLSWVSSDAFDGGNCIRPAFVSLGLTGGMLTVPFDRQMCAAKGQTGYYSQSLTGTP